jgi:hypothetical protein
VPDRNRSGSNISNTFRALGLRMMGGDAMSKEIPAEAPLDEPEGE